MSWHLLQAYDALLRPHPSPTNDEGAESGFAQIEDVSLFSSDGEKRDSVD